MKNPRLKLSALLLGASVVLLSCRDSAPVAPRAPSLAPQADLFGFISQTLKNTGLLSCKKLPYDSVTVTIGKDGGELEVGPHTFKVPKGALSGPVTITAVTPSATVNRIAFQPEGLQFARPASLTMSYANCNTLGSLVPKHIAYIDANLNILYYLISIDNLLAKKVTGQVDHFSDYAMAW